MGAPLCTYEQAITGAAHVLTQIRAHMATLTDREAALEAHAPGGPTVDQLETRIRELRDRTRDRAAA